MFEHIFHIFLHQRRLQILIIFYMNLICSPQISRSCFALVPDLFGLVGPKWFCGTPTVSHPAIVLSSTTRLSLDTTLHLCYLIQLPQIKIFRWVSLEYSFTISTMVAYTLLWIQRISNVDISVCGQRWYAVISASFPNISLFKQHLCLHKYCSIFNLDFIERIAQCPITECSFMPWLHIFFLFFRLRSFMSTLSFLTHASQYSLQCDNYFFNSMSYLNFPAYQSSFSLVSSSIGGKSPLMMALMFCNEPKSKHQTKLLEMIAESLSIYGFVTIVHDIIFLRRKNNERYMYI